MRKCLLFLVFFAQLFSLSAQSFTANSNDTIFDNQINDYPIVIDGLPNSIDTNNFGFESICLTLAHTYYC